MYKKFIKAFIGIWLQIISFVIVIEFIDRIFPIKTSILSAGGLIIFFSILIVFELFSTYASEYGIEHNILKKISKVFMFKEREELDIYCTILLGVFIILVAGIIHLR